MTEFTPMPAAIGGALIGLAAVLMMLSVGRVAGVSGFIARLIPPRVDANWPVRAAFLAGLAAGPWLMIAAGAPAPVVDVSASLGLLVGAGFLVGFGSVLGGGCTSGHGVCGTARLSRRSLVATAVFMTVGVATVFVLRHMIGG